MAKKRERPRLKRGGAGLYFTAPSQVRCIPTGCRLLDRVLGGGWAEGRVGNIVGDKSTGKSLVMIETCANFAIKYPDPKEGLIRYREAEAAFDIPYAETVGLPVDRVDFNEEVSVLTVEEWHADLEEFCDRVEGVRCTSVTKDGERKLVKAGKPAKAGLYILDSLDALGDDAENNSEFGANSYGGKKPKLMGQLFRRNVKRLERLNVTLLIVSQLRDKIGVTFGETQTRSGGRALDYYASQIIWLANMGQIKKTIDKVERPIGVKTRVRCKKNKVGLAYRECDFPIRFAFGIDDLDASLMWLDEVGMLGRLGLNDKTAGKYIKKLSKMDRDEYNTEMARVHATVDTAWFEIEKKFLPTRRKYG